MLIVLSVLALASPAQAQTTVWSATLTPREATGNTLGCDNSFSGSKCSDTNNLSGDDFTYDGRGYAISQLTLHRSGRLSLWFSSRLDESAKGLTLKVGSASFAFEDADVGSGSDGNRTWLSTGLSWTAGTPVSVSLEAPASNNAPTASNNTVTTGENTAYTFRQSDFNFSDTDPGDTLSKVKIVTLPASGRGTLALNNTAVTANQEITAANISNLTYTPPTDANGRGYAFFTFKVSDGTDESASAYTMTINVTAVNDPVPPGPESGEDEEDTEALCPEPPGTTARDVTDRETLKEFVGDSVPGIKAELEEQNELKKCYGEQGHWRHGSVYLFVISISDDGTGTVVFDGFHEELSGEELLAEDHKGNDVWEKISAALEGDGYAEYYWDDPTTEDDNNKNPRWLEDGESPGTSLKTVYVQKFSTDSEGDFIVGSGIYVEEAEEEDGEHPEEEEVGEPERDGGEPQEQGGGGGCAVAGTANAAGTTAFSLVLAVVLLWAASRGGKVRGF